MRTFVKTSATVCLVLATGAVLAGVGPTSGQDQIPKNAVRLTYVGDTAKDYRSLGASGHAVLFQRADKLPFVEAVQIFAARYGYPQPPAEDFHLYLLNDKFQILKDLTYPYGMIERTSESGDLRWYTLVTPSIEVPMRFYVALSFNPHQTKGIYLGLDKNVKQAHSFIGLPDSGFQPVKEPSDWMVRVYMSEQPSGTKGIQRPAERKPAQSVASSIQTGSVDVVYSGIGADYAAAIGKVTDAARDIYTSAGYNLPSRIRVRVECSPGKAVGLRTDGIGGIFLTLPGPEKLLRPSQSGTFNIYGLCHECGHMAMYRTLPSRPWMTTAFAEGWAHYIGSEVTDRVFARLGIAVWPDAYDYRADGTQRLKRQIAALKTPTENPVAAGAKFFMEIDAAYPNKIPQVFREMASATPTAEQLAAAVGRACRSPEAERLFVRHAAILVKH